MRPWLDIDPRTGEVVLRRPQLILRRFRRWASRAVIRSIDDRRIRIPPPPSWQRRDDDPFSSAVRRAPTRRWE